MVLLTLAPEIACLYLNARGLEVAVADHEGVITNVNLRYGDVPPAQEELACDGHLAGLAEIQLPPRHDLERDLGQLGPRNRIDEADPPEVAQILLPHAGQHEDDLLPHRSVRRLEVGPRVEGDEHLTRGSELRRAFTNARA